MHSIGLGLIGQELGSPAALNPCELLSRLKFGYSSDEKAIAFQARANKLGALLIVASSLNLHSTFKILLTSTWNGTAELL